MNIAHIYDCIEKVKIMQNFYAYIYLRNDVIFMRAVFLVRALTIRVFKNNGNHAFTVQSQYYISLNALLVY